MAVLKLTSAIQAALGKKEALKNCQTLEEVNALVGTVEFQKHVQSFDEMNNQAIDLFHHHAKELEASLKPSEKGLINDLKALPSLLYFRK